MEPRYWKVLTEDWESPIQKTKLGITKLPWVSPVADVDTDITVDCSRGWNFCDSLNKAIDIAKLVNQHGINRIVTVRPLAEIYKAKDKIRCSQISLHKPNKGVLLNAINEFHVDHKIDNKEADLELYSWLTLDRNKEENDELVIQFLEETLDSKKLKWKVVRGNNYNNNYNYNYYYNNNNNNNNYYNDYYNNYNYYNNYYNYYNNYYYNYYYITESIYTTLNKKQDSDLHFCRAIKEAYKYGMRQLRFEDNQLIYFTKSQLRQLNP